MPNKNYLRGRAIEYKAKENLLAAGASCVIRSSGSHGVFDLVAFFPDRVLAIQCKGWHRFKGKAIDDEIAVLDAVKVGPGVVKELWIWLGGKFGWRRLGMPPKLSSQT